MKSFDLKPVTSVLTSVIVASKLLL